MRGARWGLGVGALMFTGVLVGCSDAPSKSKQTETSASGGDVVPGAAPAPVATDSRPLGGFRGTITLTTPAGDVVRVPVVAQGRMVPADPSAASPFDDQPSPTKWDLFFHDGSRLLSTNGLLGLASGNADWLSDVTSDHKLRAEVVSLQPGVLGSPGWSVERDATTGHLTGRAFLRVPTAGADLAPLAYAFSLEPAADVIACDAPGAAACGEGVCDVTSGFCASQPFRAGTFRLDLELVSSHGRTRAWLGGPTLPDQALDSAAPSLMGLWCAGDAVGFDGAWTFPSLPAGAQLVMRRSGELRCVDAAGQPLTRGPVPFVSRDDLAANGMMATSPDRALLSTCLRELDRLPSRSSDPRALPSAKGYAAFRDGYLDYQAECVSLGHVAAVLTVAQRSATWDGKPPLAGQVSDRRVIGRVLQQWTQLHTFVLREGLAAARHGDAGLSLPDLLDRAADAWTLVGEVLAYDFGPSLLDARQPDYRAGVTFGLCDAVAGCGDPALRCQRPDEACAAGGPCGAARCVLDEGDAHASDPASGLAPALLDGLAAHLDVVTADAEAARLGNQIDRRSARERFGRTMRQALLIETISAMVRRRADACGDATCSPPAWVMRWEAARATVTASRARAIAAASAL